MEKREPERGRELLRRLHNIAFLQKCEFAEKITSSYVH